MQLRVTSRTCDYRSEEFLTTWSSVASEGDVSSLNERSINRKWISPGSIIEKVRYSQGNKLCVDDQSR